MPAGFRQTVCAHEPEAYRPFRIPTFLIDTHPGLTLAATSRDEETDVLGTAV